MNTIRNLLLITGIIITGMTACNYTVGECWPVGQGSGSSGETVTAGGGVIIPTGPAGVGGYGNVPPKQPQNAADPKKEIKCNADDEDAQSDTEDPADSTGGDDIQETMVNEWLEEPQPQGGVICSGPDDCVDKCAAAFKFCVAPLAVHPYKKPEQIGKLIDCIDSFPSAKYGGSYLCLYEYPSGDACAFAHGSTFGPIKFPAPPPLCVYKGGKK